MTASERDARILSLERQVMYLARRRHSTLPFARIGLDELISAGWLGAIRAVDSFDEAAGHKLNTYADWKIASAIADYLRSLDPLTRNHRRAINRGEAPEIRILSIEAPRRHVRDPYGEIPDSSDWLFDQHAAEAQSALDARLRFERIAARARLKPRSAKILMLWAQGGLMKEIGLGFNVKESRVSQICNEALAQLRLAA